MATAWLALGANMDAPDQQLKTALQHLDAHPQIRITKQSAILVNPAWGKTDQADFHNMVVEVDTALKPLPLLEVALSTEILMGRVHGEAWGPRLIDIDIVAFERELIETDRLSLPHPYAHERDFVIGPLREIAPETADWIIGLASEVSSEAT